MRVSISMCVQVHMRGLFRPFFVFFLSFEAKCISLYTTTYLGMQNLYKKIHAYGKAWFNCLPLLSNKFFSSSGQEEKYSLDLWYQTRKKLVV